jgi:hypothetical protein
LQPLVENQGGYPYWLPHDLEQIRDAYDEMA